MSAESADGHVLARKAQSELNGNIIRHINIVQNRQIKQTHSLNMGIKIHKYLRRYIMNSTGNVTQ